MKQTTEGEKVSTTSLLHFHFR